jgi:HNH endonuclease
VTGWADVVREVVARAGERCEYCRMHQALQGATFHVEHTVPSSRGGTDDLANLAWACPACNLHKSDRTSAVDPDSGAVVPLFNPRTDRWAEHFRWDGYEIRGITPTGRAAVFALDLNHPRRVMIRRAEEMFDLFPPA